MDSRNPARFLVVQIVMPEELLPGLIRQLSLYVTVEVVVIPRPIAEPPRNQMTGLEGYD